MPQRHRETAGHARAHTRARACAHGTARRCRRCRRCAAAARNSARQPRARGSSRARARGCTHPGAGLACCVTARGRRERQTCSTLPPAQRARRQLLALRAGDARGAAAVPGGTAAAPRQGHTAAPPFLPPAGCTPPAARPRARLPCAVAQPPSRAEPAGLAKRGRLTGCFHGVVTPVTGHSARTG